MRVFIDAIGIAAPGLPDWHRSRPVLRGEQDYSPAPLPAYAPARLPANERRRLTATIRLALRAAEDALSIGAATPVPELASVFVSAEGDADILNAICDALTLAERPISPTRFHNSVHNAPAGYWAIGTGLRQASTSLAAQDAGVTVGLLEAASQALLEGRPVLLVVYDNPLPPPLHELRPLSAPFACALLLNARASAASRAQLRIELNTTHAETRMPHAALESLRVGNPAARALPLLAALAGTRESMCGRLALPYLNGHRLGLELAPC